MPTETTRETKAATTAALLKHTALADKARRTGMIRSRIAEHVVFLVPGLLGFESIWTFSYFADRVVAALRSCLEQSLGQPVPVIAVPIPPTASLKERQRRLTKTLADRVHALEQGHGALRVHLVGHSTGGVDANLLTAEQPMDADSWLDIDARAPALRDRIRSVVSIASPHQGACIVRDPAAQFLSRRDRLRGIPELANLFGGFLKSAASDIEVRHLKISLLSEGAKATRLLRDVLSEWKLLPDLDPTRSPIVLEGKRDVVRKSFVTIAGSAIPEAASNSPADSLFRDLFERASGWSNGSAETGEWVRSSVNRLKQALASETAEQLVIKSSQTELPTELDAGHNDGVVNSARQLMNPDDLDELAGIVVADHFDVVGYYDRRIWSVDDEGHEQFTMLPSGLLHSGSCFRDDEFFELYQRVANVIANAALASRS
jgi:pimeloyl-ACP methyl ester carboxylesterase